MIGRPGEREDVRADSCARVDEDYVGGLLEFGKRENNSFAVVIGEVGHSCQPGSAADQAKSAGGIDDHLVELFLPGDDVREIVREIDVAENIGIGQPQVSVEQNDILSRGGELDREVHRDVALSHAALAACHGDDAGAPSLTHERAELCGLVNH